MNNINLNDFFIALIPGIISLLGIPITYIFNTLSTKNISNETKIRYKEMLDFIYLPLYTFIHTHDVDNDIKAQEEFISLLNNSLQNYPLLLDSITTDILYEYNNSKNIKPVIKNIKHIKREYEFLKHHLSYLTEYPFRKTMNMLFVFILTICVSLLFFNIPFAIISLTCSLTMFVTLFVVSKLLK